MQRKRTAGGRAFALLCLCALASSCAPQKTLRKPGGADGADASEDSSLAPGVDVEEARIRGKEFTQVPDLQPIRFEYDRYTLGAEAQAALKGNAAYLKAHPGLDVLVEGHCDQRGTIEYNLALGQKRAKEVRDYYIRLGLPGKSIATLSFGRERPACAESTEECWTRNRRAETKVRSRAAPAAAPKPKDGAP